MGYSSCRTRVSQEVLAFFYKDGLLPSTTPRSCHHQGKLDNTTDTSFNMYTSTLASFLLLVLGASAQSRGFTRSCKDWSINDVKQTTGSGFETG